MTTKSTCFGCQHLEQTPRDGGIICICQRFAEAIGEDTPAYYRIPRPIQSDCWTIRREEVAND